MTSICDLSRLRYLIFSVLFCLSANAQVGLNYYLPSSDFDSKITSPKDFFGFDIGDWHISHDPLYYYMKTLAQESDRITIKEYARSHENRPLVYLTISSPENHSKIEEIRQQNVQLTDPDLSSKVDIEDLPIIIYQGYSIHGNEPSGGNAAPLIAYYLASANDEHVSELLENAVIILDPCYNPDGFNRFASWVNSHKSKTLVKDPSNRELNEAWPRGRTNHYWFDLNRDWLLLTHPESQGRIETFHHWKPTVLTDHHEMGTNSTFFFQPGIPSRTNPNTPPLNQQLTEHIGHYHASALDSIGSQYYTKESFDDFYYGKGSTYPDINGCVGILFEQASSRGHLQESVNGDLSFPFTIRNQVVTSISTQKAAVKLRKDLLEFKREAFQKAQKEARSSKIKAYVYQSEDNQRVQRFNHIMNTHKIDVYKLDQRVTTNGKIFAPERNAYVIPVDQDQYKMVKTIFERVKTFPDSLFYDVSTWTMPLAFDLEYSELKSKYSKNLLGNKWEHSPKGKKMELSRNSYAIAIEWNQVNAPKILYKLLSISAVIKVNMEAFSMDGKSYPAGTLIIPRQQNSRIYNLILSSLEGVSAEEGLIINTLSGGLSDEGITLGSPKQSALKLPEIAMIVGDGISSYDAGEIWYTMDRIFEMPVTKLDINRFNGNSLKRYNTLILPDGNYRQFSGEDSKAIKEWIKNGGKVIAFKRALNWLNGQQMVNLISQPSASSKSNDTNKNTDYAGSSASSGAKVLGGAIFNATMDLTNPLCFGYRDNELALFKRGTQFYTPTDNPYATPIKYTEDPLLSGYMHQSFNQKAKGAAAVSLFAMNQGRIIAHVDSPVFRGYWWGGLRLFANSIFFSDLISGRALQR